MRALPAAAAKISSAARRKIVDVQAPAASLPPPRENSSRLVDRIGAPFGLDLSAGNSRKIWRYSTSARPPPEKRPGSKKNRYRLISASFFIRANRTSWKKSFSSRPPAARTVPWTRANGPSVRSALWHPNSRRCFRPVQREKIDGVLLFASNAGHVHLKLTARRPVGV